MLMRLIMGIILANIAVAVMLVGSAVAGPWEEGVAAYKRSDYMTALRLWLPLAEGGDPRAENNIGVIYENGLGVPQNAAEALKWYRSAAEHGHAGAKKNLSDLAELETPLSENTTEPTTAKVYGDCYQRGNLDLSISACTEILNSGNVIGRNRADTYYTRGTSHRDKGDFDRAIADFDKAIEFDPSDAAAYYSRGLSYDLKGYHARALIDFKVVVRLVPSNNELSDKAFVQIAKINNKVSPLLPDPPAFDQSAATVPFEKPAGERRYEAPTTLEPSTQSNNSSSNYCAGLFKKTCWYDVSELGRPRFEFDADLGTCQNMANRQYQRQLQIQQGYGSQDNIGALIGIVGAAVMKSRILKNCMSQHFWSKK